MSTYNKEQKMKRLIRFNVLLIVLLLCLIACAHSNFQETAYKALASSASVYENGYPAFLELHKQGIVSDAQKAKGRDLAVKYWAAYHAAQEALEAYTNYQSADNIDTVNVAVNEMNKLLIDLTKYIEPFLKAR
jgi:hypothetical protein